MDFSLVSTVLGSPAPRELARFYVDLLGWRFRDDDDPEWVVIKPADGSRSLSFQLEDAYVAPVWPAEPGDQQMQTHLDIGVAELGPAVAHAVELGATVAGFQPQELVRVLLDPHGHPFCLFAPGG